MPRLFRSRNSRHCCNQSCVELKPRFPALVLIGSLHVRCFRISHHDTSFVSFLFFFHFVRYRGKASTFTRSTATTIPTRWQRSRLCVKATNTSSSLRYENVSVTHEPCCFSMQKSLIVKYYRLSHDVVTCDIDRDVSTAYC